MIVNTLFLHKVVICKIFTKNDRTLIFGQIKAIFMRTIEAELERENEMV